MKKSNVLWQLLMAAARKIVSVMLKFFHIEWSEEQWHTFEQFCQFVLVGCSNAAITLVIYYIVVWINPAFYLVGNTIGYIAGVFNSFFWNSRYVFQSNNVKKSNSFLKMCCCYSLTYLIQTGILYFFVNKMCIGENIAPIITILITTPINFLLNKLWAFNS